MKDAYNCLFERDKETLEILDAIGLITSVLLITAPFSLDGHIRRARERLREIEDNIKQRVEGEENASVGTSRS